jgi:hypothetical protein
MIRVEDGDVVEMKEGEGREVKKRDGTVVNGNRFGSDFEEGPTPSPSLFIFTLKYETAH